MRNGREDDGQEDKESEALEKNISREEKECIMFRNGEYKDKEDRDKMKQTNGKLSTRRTERKTLRGNVVR